MLREMTMNDYPAVMALWQQTPGVCVREADSADAIARYLARNPGLSFVACDEGRVIGCLMSGHDGRRGYLQHLLVLPAYRGRGIARTLVDACLDALLAQGIAKSHIDVLRDNHGALDFWQKIGWQQRHDIHRFSFIRAGGANI